MLDRATPPEAKTIDEFSLLKAKTEKLDNGLPIHIIPAGKQPIIKLEFIFWSGAWFEPQNGVSLFTTKMLGEGTKKRNSKEIISHFDQYGARLHLKSGMDYAHLTLYTLSKHLKVLLPLIQEIILSSIFPEKELEVLKNIRKQQIKVDNQKNGVVATKRFRELIFGITHPYGKNLSEDGVSKIKANQLKSFHQEVFLNRFEVVLSGDFSSEYLKLLNQYFGAYQFNYKKTSTSIAADESTEKLLLKKQGSLQSSIRVGRLLVRKNHRDYIKLLFVNELLGGFFGSRLMKNIREEKGYTYGIQSNIVPLKHESLFIVGTDVKKEDTEKTLDETYKEIESLVKEPPDHEEMETVKNYMIGAFLSDINTPFSLADRFKSVYLHELDYSYYDQYFETISKITSEEVAQIAQKYFDPQEMVEVVVGDK